MNPTHQKRPYRAECIEWTGNNFEAICALIPDAELCGTYVTIRGHGWLRALAIGDWVVQGENGAIKCYTPEQFAVKYEPYVQAEGLVSSEAITTGAANRPSIYISGPMTGVPEHNFPAFHAAAAMLREWGYEAINPAEINQDTDGVF